VELNTGDLQATRASHEISLSAATGDLAHPSCLVVELNTGDLLAAREGAGIPFSISRAETPSALRRPLATRAGGGARRSHGAASPRKVFAAPACCLFSNATSLASNSPPSTKARAEVTKFITCVASPGDRMPAAQAARTACAALTKSPALWIGGRSNTTGRSRSGGKSRPTQKRNAGPSPAKALAMRTRVSSSAAPSSTPSSASVALLREPLGRPRRLTPQRCANDCPPLIGIAGAAPAAGSRSSMVVGSSRLAALPASAEGRLMRPRQRRRAATGCSAAAVSRPAMIRSSGGHSIIYRTGVNVISVNARLSYAGPRHWLGDYNT
jgi:hypothetical protein